MYFCTLPSVWADRCTWLFDVCELPVFLRGDHISVHGQMSLLVTYSISRKESRSHATLAENGLGNLDRFLICNTLLLLPGDCLHVHTLAKGTESLHGIVGM